MNIDTLIKILSIFNKPFHFLIAGVVILKLGQASWQIWGWLLIGLSIASLMEWCFNLIKEKINKRQRINQEQEEKNREKENLYRAYDDLNWDEKVVVFNCVHDNNIVCKDAFKRREEEFLALQIKGFGKRDGFEKFVIRPKYLKWLSEYEQVENDYQYYYSEEENDEEE